MRLLALALLISSAALAEEPAPPAAEAVTDEAPPPARHRVEVIQVIPVQLEPPAAEAAPPAAPAVVEVPAPAEPPPPPPAPPPAPQVNKFGFNVSGYVKLGLSAVETDPRAPFIGQSDGFQLLNARVLMFGSYGSRLTFELSIDGAQDPGGEPEQGVLRRLFNLEDAFAQVRMGDAHWFRFGQSKAPFSAEDLMSTSRLKFVHRSVVNDGVAPSEGLVAAPGLGLDRQLGVGAGGGVDLAGTYLEYEIAGVNGNGPNQAANDNSRIAGLARVKATVRFSGAKLELGASGAFNPASTGVLPNRFLENQIGYAGDVTFAWKGVHVFGMLLGRRSTFEDTKLDPASALGIVGQAAYLIEALDLEPAYRFATYDPNSLFPNDAVTHHTIGLNYQPGEGPLRMLVNYTLKLEQAGREVNNNALEGAVQVSF